MAKYIVLFNYIKKKNEELDSKYSISKLSGQLRKYKKYLEMISSDIVNISDTFVRDLFIEKYSQQETLEFLKAFYVLIDLKRSNIYIEKQEILGSKIAIFLKEFENLLKKKISEINDEINKMITEKQTEQSKYINILKYFDISEDRLVKVLSKDELQNLIDFIKKIDIESSNKFDIILALTVDNKLKLEEIYPNALDEETKRKVASKNQRAGNILEGIEDTIEQLDEVITEPEEIIETPELAIELTPEEINLINHINEIYNILKNEVKPSSSDRQFVEIFNDYSLVSRKIFDDENPSIKENNWGYIYLDLKINFHIESDSFLGLFNENKEAWTDIFNYYISLYNTRFISKKSVTRELDVFTITEKTEINKYKSIISELTEETKAKYQSANYIYQAEGEDGLKRIFGYNLTKEHIDFHNKLLEFQELYLKYEKLEQLSINDIYVLAQVKGLIDELKEKMLELIKELNELKEKIEIPKLNLSDYVNLLILFPSETIDILDEQLRQRKLMEIIDQQKINMSTVLEGETEKYFQNGLRQIDDKLLKVEFSRLLLRNKDDKCRLKSNKYTERKVTEYPAYRIRGSGPKGERVCYLKLDLTDNNKRILMDIFDMRTLDYLCVVLTIDGSLSDKKDYVGRASKYIETEETYIQEIIRIFTNDFTKETLTKAVRIITNSFNDLFSLRETVQMSQVASNTQISVSQSEDSAIQESEQPELGGEESNVK